MLLTVGQMLRSRCRTPTLRWWTRRSAAASSSARSRSPDVTNDWRSCKALAIAARALAGETNQLKCHATSLGSRMVHFFLLRRPGILSKRFFFCFSKEQYTSSIQHQHRIEGTLFIGIFIFSLTKPLIINVVNTNTTFL